MRPTLCDTFRSLSFLTWDMLAKGRSVDCQIGEETLTDINILELKIRHSSEIYTRTFSTTQEGSEGADWEWWFTGSSKKWIGFRVQAKVIEFKSNSFKHLHYPKGSRYQCDLLIERALKSPSPLVPLYCLYSNWNNSPQFTSRYANYYPVQESYGCSILSAFAVRYLQSKKRKPANFKVLRQYMTPWDGLVCCYGDRASDLPHRVFENCKKFIHPIEREILDELDESIFPDLDGELNHCRRIYDDFQLINEPPKHVQLLLKNELVDQPDRHLRSLTVFQERNEPIEIDF